MTPDTLNDAPDQVSSQPADTPTAVRRLFRVTLVVAAVAPFVTTLLGGRPSDIVAASALLMVAAGCLLVRVARGPDSEWVGFGEPVAAAVPGLLVLGITLFPPAMFLLVAPLLWVTAVWSGPPSGLGLLPPWSRYPVEVAFAHHQAVAMTIAAVAAGVLGYAVRRRWRSVLHGVGLVLPLAVVLALAASGVRWPVIALTLLVSGAGLTAAAAFTPGDWRRPVSGMQGFPYLASGTAMCLSTPQTTQVALVVMTLGGVWAGWRGREASRVPGWIFTVLLGAATAAVGIVVAGLSRQQSAFGVVAVAVAALAFATMLRGTRRREATAIEVAAHIVMIAAIVLSVGSLPIARTVVAIWAAALALRLAWPATSTSDRRYQIGIAAVWATMTWWLLRGAPGENLTEDYTLPMAVTALIFGWATRRRWPLTRPWKAYGPAVALALLPTLKIAAETHDQVRWLVFGVGAVAALGAMAVSRRRRHEPSLGG